jgi:hypothetical protein
VRAERGDAVMTGPASFLREGDRVRPIAEEEGRQQAVACGRSARSDHLESAAFRWRLPFLRSHWGWAVVATSDPASAGPSFWSLASYRS